MTVRILIADDHRMLREALVQTLLMEPDFQVVAEVAGGRQAVEQAGRLAPDVIILDIGMSDLDGIEACRRIKQAGANARILALTIHDDSEHVGRMIEAGAAGYLVKTRGLDDLIEAVRCVAAGEHWLCPEAAKAAMRGYARLQQDAAAADTAQTLSPQERRVYDLIGEGLGPTDIGDELHISVHTVETYYRRLREKLGLLSARELRRHAIRHRHPS